MSKATSSTCCSGFDFARWRPRLILLEDHVGNLDKHRFLTRARLSPDPPQRLQRLVRAGQRAAKVDWRGRWEILRKYYLALPFRMARNLSRRLRGTVGG